VDETSRVFDVIGPPISQAEWGLVRMALLAAVMGKK
jgi:hypothetical protein